MDGWMGWDMTTCTETCGNGVESLFFALCILLRVLIFVACFTPLTAALWSISFHFIGRAWHEHSWLLFLTRFIWQAVLHHLSYPTLFCRLSSCSFFFFFCPKLQFPLAWLWTSLGFAAG